ncbi:hypothetical protein Tco_0749027 [Tanacetum coccineum]|uniref:Uncharacterized protein n=1 Tax=Tanacetum coccineum TaxID=301880 RepID=A0ABQ4YZT4_9ASTR
MNQEQIQQTARDEALVPIADRVKIIKKIKKTTFYEFDLDDKNCKVDAELFMNILSISPRVPNQYFIVPLSEESMITFLYELGYKGQINKLSSMFVDHMHQPWRTLAAIINKCLSGKTSTYKAFIGYSTGSIPPKKSRGKGSQGKKQTVTPKKKDSITADDNIIPEPGVSFELGMSINRIKAKIAKEARRVHETHECLVTEMPASEKDSDESEGEPANRSTRRRRAFEEQLVADMMQDIKARKIVSRSQPHTEGSNEGAGITPESDWSNEGKVNKEEIKWVSSDEDEYRQDDHDDNDDRSIDLEETYDEDEYAEYEAHANEYVHDVVDEEIKDAKNVETRKDNEEITDVEKADAEKTAATKSDYKQVRKLPPTRSSLSVSSSFGNQFLNISFDISLIALLHAPSVTTISSLLKQTTPILTPPFTTITLAVTTAIPDPLPAVIQRLSDLKNKFKAWTKVNHSKFIVETIKNQVPEAVYEFVAPRLERTIQDMLTKNPPKIFKSSCFMSVDSFSKYELKNMSRPEDKEEDPYARSNQRMKKRKKSKDAKSSKKTDQSGLTKGTTQSQHSLSSKSVQAEETVYEVAYTDQPLNHENDVNNADDQPDAEVTPKTDKSTWFKQPPRPPTPDPKWNKGKAVEDGPE